MEFPKSRHTTTSRLGYHWIAECLTQILHCVICVCCTQPETIIICMGPELASVIMWPYRNLDVSNRVRTFLKFRPRTPVETHIVRDARFRSSECESWFNTRLDFVIPECVCQITCVRVRSASSVLVFECFLLWMSDVSERFEYKWCKWAFRVQVNVLNYVSDE